MRPGQVSRICSCVSIGLLHILHFSCWYLFLKFALMSSILVLALKIMDVSILLSLFMWGLRFPACHWAKGGDRCQWYFSSGRSAD